MAETSIAAKHALQLTNPKVQQIIDLVQAMDDHELADFKVFLTSITQKSIPAASAHRHDRAHHGKTNGHMFAPNNCPDTFA